MLTELHWVEGPWPGRLALSARPRGGDWLADEMSAWRRSGVDAVFSLLTEEEEHDLGMSDESEEAALHAMNFFTFPILDRQVPNSGTALLEALQKLDRELSSGHNVVLHCRQGIGRTGLVAACLLITKGVDPERAVRRLSVARGVAVPETPEQRRWIDHFSTTLEMTR